MAERAVARRLPASAQNGALRIARSDSTSPSGWASVGRPGHRVSGSQKLALSFATLRKAHNGCNIPPGTAIIFGRFEAGSIRGLIRSETLFPIPMRTHAASGPDRRWHPEVPVECRRLETMVFYPSIEV